MPTLKITLKQHTPLIHFQHTQEGATLRASEVKPKLDRFILTKLGKDYEKFSNDEKQACQDYLKLLQAKNPQKTELTVYEKGFARSKQRGWLVGKGEHGALDYKMRIFFSNNNIEYVIASTPRPFQRINNIPSNIKLLFDVPFFAQEKSTYGEENNDKRTVIYYETKTNNDGKKEKDKHYFDEESWNKIEKKGILHKGLITIIVHCMDEELEKRLSEYMEPFFIVTNFGTRQSKGFGTFTIESMKVNDTPQEVKKDYLDQLKKNYKYVYSKKSTNFENAFSEIKKDYQLLKAGINFHDYTKSLLYCFCERSKIGVWEKRTIKNEMTKNGITPYSKPLYKRNPDNSCAKCSTANSISNDKFIRALLGLAEHYEFNNSKVQVKIDGGENFERFKSPITFKIIDNTIYLLGNPINENIFSHFFSFQIYENGKCKGNPFTLSTPINFSLEDFLEYCMIKSGKFNYIKEYSI